MKNEKSVDERSARIQVDNDIKLSVTKFIGLFCHAYRLNYRSVVLSLVGCIREIFSEIPL